MKQLFVIIYHQQVVYHGHINKMKIVNGILIYYNYSLVMNQTIPFKDKQLIIMETYFQ